MRHRYAVSFESQAAPTSGFKTMVHIPCGTSTNPRIVVVRRVILGLDGVDATKLPVKFQWKYQNGLSGTLGTPGSTVTPTPIGAGIPAAITSSVGINYSAEPTTGGQIDAYTLSPNSVTYAEPFALDVEYEGDPGTAGRSALGLLINAPNAVNVTGCVWFEE